MSQDEKIIIKKQPLHRMDIKPKEDSDTTPVVLTDAQLRQNIKNVKKERKRLELQEKYDKEIELLNKAKEKRNSADNYTSQILYNDKYGVIHFDKKKYNSILKSLERRANAAQSTSELKILEKQIAKIKTLSRPVETVSRHMSSMSSLVNIGANYVNKATNELGDAMSSFGGNGLFDPVGVPPRKPPAKKPAKRKKSKK